MARWLLAFGLLLVAGVGTGEETRPVDNLPREVRQAEQVLTRWLQGFIGQTPEQVRKALGAPTKESHWILEEKKEPCLKYKLGEGTELALYFRGGRVLKAGLHLLP
jgi:hypothetical protein